MIDFCAKTKQVLVREITKENLENLTILRQELLLLLLQSNDLIDSHQFVKYDLLLMTYQNKYAILLIYHTIWTHILVLRMFMAHIIWDLHTGDTENKDFLDTASNSSTRIIPYHQMVKTSHWLHAGQ